MTVAPRHRNTGFSLVEIMVGMVIGMLGIFAIMQVFAVSEGYKRTTTGGNDAQNNGAVGLYFIERDARMAGYGIATKEADGALAQCAKVKAYNSSRSPANFDFGVAALYPFVINPASIPAGDANSDVIQLSYSGSFGMLGTGIGFTASADNSYLPTPRIGYRLGDLVLAVQSGMDCTIAEVTSLPSGKQCGEADDATKSSWVIHGVASYNSFYLGCAAKTPSWNPGGAPPLGVTFTAGKLYNLGPPGALVSRIYAVRGGRLTTCDMTASDCTSATEATKANTGVKTSTWLTLTDGIVSLQAQYGRAAADDGVVTTWDKTLPLTTATADFDARRRLLAVRMAIVAKSGQYEKAVVTPNNPTWLGGSINIGLLNGDNNHYRYKTFQSVVPLRNMVWGN